MSSISWRRSSISSSRDSSRALWSGLVSLRELLDVAQQRAEPGAVQRGAFAGEAVQESQDAGRGFGDFVNDLRPTGSGGSGSSCGSTRPQFLSGGRAGTAAQRPGSCRRSCSRKASTSAWNSSSGKLRPGPGKGCLQHGDHPRRRTRQCPGGSFGEEFEVPEPGADGVGGGPGGAGHALSFGCRGSRGVGQRIRKTASYKVNAGPERIDHCPLPTSGAHWKNQLRGDDHAEENHVDHRGGDRGCGARRSLGGGGGEPASQGPPALAPGRLGARRWQPGTPTTTETRRRRMVRRSATPTGRWHPSAALAKVGQGTVTEVERDDETARPTRWKCASATAPRSKLQLGTDFKVLSQSAPRTRRRLTLPAMPSGRCDGWTGEAAATAP